MGQERNKAFEGPHAMPDGKTWALVHYFKREDCKTRFNRDLRRDSEHWRVAGWYWVCSTGYRSPRDLLDSRKVVWHGPYTASGNAYRAARKAYWAKGEKIGEPQT